MLCVGTAAAVAAIVGAADVAKFILQPHAAALDSSTNDRHRVPYPSVVAIVARWSCPSSAGGGGGEFSVYVHMRLCARLYFSRCPRNGRRRFSPAAETRRHGSPPSTSAAAAAAFFLVSSHSVWPIFFDVFTASSCIINTFSSYIIRVGAKKEERRPDPSLRVVTAYGFCPLCTRMYVRGDGGGCVLWTSKEMIILIFFHRSLFAAPLRVY